MINKHYYVSKNSFSQVIGFDTSCIDGFDITPKNSIRYDGIIVNRLVIIKQAFVEKILKKKIKKKLELYLKFIMDFIDGEEGSSDTLREVLNDVTRYKDIINYRYRKHLGDKYIDSLLKKIDLLAYELKIKIYIIDEKQSSLDDYSVGSKSR